MIRNSVVRLLVLAFGVIISFVATDARAACKLYDDMVAARAAQATAFQQFHSLKLSPEMEKKVLTYDSIITIDRDIDYDVALGLQGQLWTPQEKVVFEKWKQETAQARTKLDAANATAHIAERAWRDRFNKKEELLDKADKLFRDEQAWLQTEKEALRKLEVNSPEYLDRASKLTERLKKSYSEIKANLDPFRDCFTDVDTFVTDIEKRLARIKLVDEEIARRRGTQPTATPAGVPGVTTLHPDRPADVKLKPGVTAPDNTNQNATDAPLNPKYGDAWVWDGNKPQVQVKTNVRHLLVSSDANGASWTVTSEDGTKTGIAGCKITKAPKRRIQVGEPFEVRMTAYGQPPAAAWGGIYTDNFHGGDTWGQHNGGDCRDDTKPEGICSRYFYVPEGAEKRWIEARMWRPLSGGDQDPAVWVVWTYVREGGKK
jgi:hypothetical protein